MEEAPVRLDLLFETSWEVCNKVGGIYTVLSTKAFTLTKLYEDRVVFVGPDVWSEESESPFFIECRTSLDEWKSKVDLPNGIKVRTGKWNVPGNPTAVLVKFDSLFAENNRFYGEMWTRFGVDSLHGYGDYGEACAFSHAAGIVIESIFNYKSASNRQMDRVVAHFDEWTTGMGLLYLKWKAPSIATIFTTHATSIGRSICGNNKPLYGQLPNYNGDQMARELNMESKHSLEKTAARQADCFTTVSEVTAKECEQLLELMPHVVTPNGFEANFVPAKPQLNAKRKKARRKLLEVASALTGKKFGEETFLIATSGRYEWRNKGIDVFIDVMKELSENNLSKQAVAFILVPGWVKERRDDLKSRLNGQENGRPEPLIPSNLTHYLNNQEYDNVLRRLDEVGLTIVSDKLNVVFVPCYLNGDDGIFDMTYYDLLPGFDVTVFPSYYEPWGYTPLESIAFGVPTVTTSLAGFGQWILITTDNQLESCGVSVVGRGDYNYREVVENIRRVISYLISCDKSEINAISTAAMKTAAKAEWKYFIKYYVEAYKIAIENRNKRIELQNS